MHNLIPTSPTSIISNILYSETTEENPPQQTAPPGGNGGCVCTKPADFRKNILCEDQILCLTQWISEGYQAAKAKKIILVIPD